MIGVGTQMEEKRMTRAALEPYRVLDLTDHRGEIAGMMLGDLGADVIRVEPPCGSEARREEPTVQDGKGGHASLQFYAYNRNKRAIALDLSEPGDRQTFFDLVKTADFVLESGPGGELEEAGIGFGTLKALQPQIVHLKLTPFGADGPHADWVATDLTIAAMAGPVSLQGVPERAPVRLSVPQAWRHAGGEMAVAALVAHARMRQTGEAQFVDVSAQCAMTWTMLNGLCASAVQGEDFKRSGSDLQLGQTTLPLVFECKDGHAVSIPTGKLMQVLVDWMVEDEVVPADWADQVWEGFEARLLAGEELPYTMDDIIDAIRRYAKLHTKSDLFYRALKESATIAPCKTVADLLDFPQLQDRHFWNEGALPNGQSVLVPGAFARMPEPLPIHRPAPGIDEHGAEIRAELKGRSSGRVLVSPEGGQLPFEGLKVADFSWIGVGPMTCRYLADHGATVVRVESESRPDNLRGVAPFKDGVPGWNRSHFYGNMNTSKLGLDLNLKQPAAVEAARRLIAWADVYVESFTPGTVDDLGIGYEVARSLNPEIVMLSTCLMGQTGPVSSMAGYGYHAGAVAGFYEVTGWPDLPPDGPWMAYTDTVAPRFTASALMAALDHARRTGEGSCIDGAQFEMGLQFLAPEILDFQAHGYSATRMGNRDRWLAPHGVYRCAGEDEWCAIAVEDTQQWQSLVGELGAPAEWAGLDLDDLQVRQESQDALDAWITAWTSSRAPDEVATRLQAVGVPCGAVQRARDLLADPQYTHRGFHRYLTHPEMGEVPYAGHQFRIAGYESGPRSPAPCLGEHSFEVLQGLLGFSDEEIAELVACGGLS
ncbi:MAG: CaiB/BaiF CoA transferase family protein [Myxococcota bacterium]